MDLVLKNLIGYDQTGMNSKKVGQKCHHHISEFSKIRCVGSFFRKLVVVACLVAVMTYFGKVMV